FLPRGARGPTLPIGDIDRSVRHYRFGASGKALLINCFNRSDGCKTFDVYVTTMWCGGDAHGHILKIGVQTARHSDGPIKSAALLQMALRNPPDWVIPAVFRARKAGGD